MRKLAKTVGVTAPALYRHYDSKEQVLIAVIGEAYREFAQYIYRALAGRSPWERMARAGQEYLNFALERPHMYEMLYTSPHVIGLTAFPEEVLDVACSTDQFWQDRVRECMGAGYFREADPTGVSVTMWAHAHGLISIFLKGFLPMDHERFRSLYHASWDRLMTGLGGEQWAPVGAEQEVDAVGVNGVNDPETSVRTKA